MVSKVRLERIIERIHQELSEILLQEVADPRIAGVGITRVKVDRELAYADIFVSAPVEPQEIAPILDGLNHAQGYLRSLLASRIELRIFPRLRFHWDPIPTKADQMEKLFAQIRRERGEA